MVNCNKCGCPLTLDGIEVLNFRIDGSDYWDKEQLKECDNEAVYLDLQANWTGCEFDDDMDEKRASIRCPRCHKYPFKKKEIQTYQIIRVVMFDEKKHRIGGETDELNT